MGDDMNLEEAKANIGKEVIYIGDDRELIDDVLNGKKLIIAEPTKRMATNVLIEYDELCFWNIDPQHLKLKEQPMQNYKIKVTPETSEEVQKLFFELGYHWRFNGKDIMEYTKDLPNIFSYNGCLYNYVSHEKRSNSEEITLPQLRDLVVLKRNDAGDATHEHINGTKVYVCCKGISYFWSRTGWEYKEGSHNLMVLSKSEMKVKELNKFVHLKPTEMNFRDALIAINNGEEVEFLHNGDWVSFVECAFENYKFRIKPKTIHVDGGDYTKEEWLKILSEFE